MDSTEILINIRRIVRSINLESKQIQKQYGVSIPQVLCLGFLHKSEDYCAKQTDIKKYLNLNASTVSGILQRLEIRGFIARLAKKGDKRVAHWALTASGFQAIDKMPPLMHQQLSSKLGQLPQTELTQINQALEKLTKILQIDKIDASPMLTNDI